MTLLDYLKSAEKSLFRFEAQQEYKVEDDMSPASMQAWWNFIESKITNHVLMQRVKLIREPVNDYTKKELEMHRKSVTHGDIIKIIKYHDIEKSNIPTQDFWIIDDILVLEMNYSTTREYLGFNVIKSNIRDYIKIKKPIIK